MSQAVFNISPFAHVHSTREVSIASLAWLVVIAAALTAAGLTGFQRREID